MRQGFMRSIPQDRLTEASTSVCIVAQKVGSVKRWLICTIFTIRRCQNRADPDLTSLDLPLDKSRELMYNTCGGTNILRYIDTTSF